MSALAHALEALEKEIHLSYGRAPESYTTREEQRLYARITDFLMDLPDDDWWCQFPSLMTFMVRSSQLHPRRESPRTLYDQMGRQLGRCTECVDAYHAELDSFYADLERTSTPAAATKAFFRNVARLDAERIQAVFTAPSPPPAAVVSTALYEILTVSWLRLDVRITHVISNWLKTTADHTAISDKMTLRIFPGVFEYLVSPEPRIREWATSLVENHVIDVDISEENSHARKTRKVLNKWVEILESALLNTSLLNLDLRDTEELAMFFDVNHYVGTPTSRIVWPALNTVMQSLTLLGTFNTLPDAIFIYLDCAKPANADPLFTFGICKCNGILLRRLGHRYWNRRLAFDSRDALDLVLHHCQLSSWPVSVTKQFIDALPPLVASMRPRSKSPHEGNETMLMEYFEARTRVLRVLVEEGHRPDHFIELALSIAASRAVSSIVCGCYKPPLTAYTAESSFWWPCGPGCEDIEQIWIPHLFSLLTDPKNTRELVDHVAITCSLMLQGHLSLAREVTYSLIKSRDGTAAQSTILPAKPIVTRLATSLCSLALEEIASIPYAVHGALFESIGGVAELLNIVEAQPQPTQELLDFKAMLKKYELLLCDGYLEHICDEVLFEKLFRAPVVAQHLAVCLLTPNIHVVQRIKGLLAYADASEAMPHRFPPPLAVHLTLAKEDTKAYLGGVLSLLQRWQRHDFPLSVMLPTVKKVILPWIKIFKTLGDDIKEALRESGEAYRTQSQEASSTFNGLDLQKLPKLIGDFIVRLLAELYSPSRQQAVKESELIQCFDFSITIWKFLSKEEKELVSSKRFEGLIAPLSRCIESLGGPLEKDCAAKLLITVLEGFAEGQTRLDDVSIVSLDAIDATMTATISPKVSIDFARVVSKLREVASTPRTWYASIVAQSLLE